MRRIKFFENGEVIDDMIVDKEYYDENKKMTMAICHCKICNRIKNMNLSCLREHRGTTHRACGQNLKTVDKRFYNTWQGLKSRIYNENYEHFDRYGGRGLTTDYDLFIDFYDDMYNSYLEAVKIYGENISLDRIDNNIGYVKGNLRWTTQVHQVRNSSKIKEFYAISPENIVCLSNNQTQFAINHNLSPKQVSAVINGRFKTTNGWKFIFKDEVKNFPFFAQLELYY